MLNPNQVLVLQIYLMFLTISPQSNPTTTLLDSEQGFRL